MQPTDQLREQKAPLMSVPTKTALVGGGATGATGYLALWFFQKWGIPLELTAAAVTLVGAAIGRWAGKLQP
jgi:hypothetical protein